ncbi:MAG: protein-export chaperone SecB [Pseudomonadota bacterium]
MSDETTNAGGEDAAEDAGAGAAEQPMEAPAIRLAAHYIRDLSFENVAAQEGSDASGTPEISIQVNLDAKAINETQFQIAMSVNATAKAGESTRFIVELDYVGIFELKNIPQEHMHPMLFIECPRQLLPFTRRVVADVTRDGGYPPLMLDNVDFANLYRARLAEIQAQQAAEGGAPN